MWLSLCSNSIASYFYLLFFHVALQYLYFLTASWKIQFPEYCSKVFVFAKWEVNFLVMKTRVSIHLSSSVVLQAFLD